MKNRFLVFTFYIVLSMPFMETNTLHAAFIYNLSETYRIKNLSNFYSENLLINNRISKTYKKEQKPNSLPQKKTKKKNIFTSVLLISLPLFTLVFGLIFSEILLILMGGIFSALLVLYFLGALSIVLKNSRNIGAAFLLFLVGGAISASIFLGISFILFIVGLAISNITVWAVALGILLVSSVLHFIHWKGTKA